MGILATAISNASGSAEGAPSAVPLGERVRAVNWQWCRWLIVTTQWLCIAAERPRLRGFSHMAQDSRPARAFLVVLYQPQNPSHKKFGKSEIFLVVGSERFGGNALAPRVQIWQTRMRVWGWERKPPGPPR
jgi:hypothetical protein